MARIYSNENFPLPAVTALRDFGHDVLTIQETGRAGIASTDSQVLDFAASDSRILLTLDRRHFIRLHQSGVPHAGIIVCSVDPDFEGQARKIHDAIAAEGEMLGKLLRVYRTPN